MQGDNEDVFVLRLKVEVELVVDEVAVLNVAELRVTVWAQAAKKTRSKIVTSDVIY